MSADRERRGCGDVRAGGEIPAARKSQLGPLPGAARPPRRHYFKLANDWTIACPQIETRGALDQLDEILALDGVDMVCFGPNDLSVALTGRLDIWAPEVKEAMTLVLSKCREMSVIAFVFANDAEYAKPRLKEGWNMVAVGTDAGLFSKGAAEARAAAKANS